MTKGEPETTKILIVDDDPDIIRTVQAILTGRGYDVVCAENGKEGFGVAKKERPDLIILDVMMPVMDGFTLIRHLRILSAFMFVPIIFLTTLDSVENRLQGFRLGADDFLDKQDIFPELPERVQMALEKSTIQQENALMEVSEKSRSEKDFSGSLAAFGLTALLGLCKMQQCSGILNLQHDEGMEGSLNILEGEVISAHVHSDRPAANEQAVYMMVSWATGQFNLMKDEIGTSRPGITMPTDMLLMEAVRRLDEGISPFE